jgi:hypothetical protein
MRTFEISLRTGTERKYRRKYLKMKKGEEWKPREREFGISSTLSSPSRSLSTEKVISCLTVENFSKMKAACL